MQFNCRGKKKVYNRGHFLFRAVLRDKLCTRRVRDNYDCLGNLLHINNKVHQLQSLLQTWTYSYLKSYIQLLHNLKSKTYLVLHIYTILHLTLLPAIAHVHKLTHIFLKCVCLLLMIIYPKYTHVLIYSAT